MAKLNEDVKVVMLKGEKGERGEAGQGIPSGGKTGQAIIKASDNDYDYKWGSLVVDDVANATNDGNGNNIVNTYATKEELNKAKTDASKIYATKEELGDSLNFDKIYPIGSIYMSMNGTNPATLFGGTWEQLKDRFLLGAGNTYSAGSTGGETTHKLTIAEMPSHMHHMKVAGGGNLYDGVTIGPGAYTSNENTSEEGDDQPHNNMPPYLAVYMWKRTA